MPNYIRPIWIEVTSDSLKRIYGTGPTTRDGKASANIKVRQNGNVLNLLDVVGVGSSDGQTVRVTVTDRRTGRVIFEEIFEQ